MPPEIAALGSLRFQYIDLATASVVHHIEVSHDSNVYVIGNPGDGSYEWVYLADGAVAGKSNDGYGISASALRDGLSAALD